MKPSLAPALCQSPFRAVKDLFSAAALPQSPVASTPKNMAHILIIDDEEGMRSLLVKALVQEGHAVREAPDGRVAMKSISSLTPDLIITDLLMPEKEGIETIVDVRKKYPAIKIIAMSGGLRHGKFDLLGLAAKVGADRTLAKPFSIFAMLATVKELLPSQPGPVSTP
jgi:DNA-binding response OmpR family regulator